MTTNLTFADRDARLRYDRIRTALATLPPSKRDLPKPVADALALEAAIQDARGASNPHALAGELVGCDPADFSDTLARLSAAHTHAAFLTATAQSVAGRLAERATHALADAVPELVKRLAPVVIKAADDLAAAAAGFPAGNAALDPSAIVAERSATEAFHLAKDAASIIVRACGVYPLTETGDDPKGVALVLAASIPPGIVQLYDGGPSRFGQNTDDETATIQAMRDLTATYAADPSLALVRIARGEFPGGQDRDAGGQRRACGAPREPAHVPPRQARRLIERPAADPLSSGREVAAPWRGAAHPSGSAVAAASLPSQHRRPRHPTPALAHALFCGA